jgi:hypothetical protein
MYPETKPIIFNCPSEYRAVEVYPIHDLHYGNECFDAHRWNILRDYILSEPNRYVVWVGDLMENALPNSKSDPLTQIYSPLEQREFVAEQFKAFDDRTIAIVDGNHEYNRSTRFAGLYPLYDAACIAGIEDKYRSAYAVMDISVGSGADRHKERAYRYIGFATHKAKDMKSFGTVDCLDGFDFLLYGHDHEAREHARCKLTYNANKRTITFRSVEAVNCGSFLSFGGYGAHGGYRPQTDKMYKLILYGEAHRIDTVGFYPTKL